MAWRSGSGALFRLFRPSHRRLANLPSLCHYTSNVEIDDEKPPRRKKSSRNTSQTVPVTGSSAPVQPLPDTSIDGDTLLLKSLKKHLKDAPDIINKYQTANEASFKPFELVPNVGSGDLTLRRKIGHEEVVVKCLLELEEPDDEEYLVEENEDNLKIVERLTLNIKISKGSSEDEPRIAFLCTYAKSAAIVIEDIAYLGKSTYEEYPYSGPFYPDLNANLKQAFQNVVKARGINSSLADQIIDHLSTKYQAEYVLWLQNVRSFLKRNLEVIETGSECDQHLA